jgi:hypothetical protein
MRQQRLRDVDDNKGKVLTSKEVDERSTQRLICAWSWRNSFRLRIQACSHLLPCSQTSSPEPSSASIYEERWIILCSCDYEYDPPVQSRIQAVTAKGWVRKSPAHFFFSRKETPQGIPSFNRTFTWFKELTSKWKTRTKNCYLFKLKLKRG